MYTNIQVDSSSFIPDPTSLHNMRVVELLKENLGPVGHISQSQGKVMSGGDRMGS